MKNRKILIAILAILAGPFLLYLVAANIFLSTGLLRSAVNKGPEKTWIDYHSATSFWPGRARVKNFRLRDRDETAEWIFELEDARLSFSVLGLLKRRFHVTGLTGSGLMFRARNRLSKEAATPERTALLPPIFGFADPPLLPPRPRAPKAPRTGKEFTIRVEDLAVDPVREIWVDSYRYDGGAKLTGGFFLQPKLRAEVFPSALQVRGGALLAGKDTVASRIRGALGGVVRSWEPRRFPGSKMIRFIAGEARVEADLRSAEVVNRLIGDLPGTRLEKLSGALTVAAALDGGTASGKIALSATDVALRALDVRLRGKLDLEARIARLDLEKGGAELSGGKIVLSDATVVEKGEKAHPWWVRVTLQEGGNRPEGGKSPVVLTSRLSAKARDARPLLLLLNTKLPDWAQDLLAMEGLTARATVRLGKSLIEIRRLDAEGGKIRIQGDYRAKGTGKRGMFLIDAGALAVGVGMNGGKTELQVLGPRKWFRERTGREAAED